MMPFSKASTYIYISTRGLIRLLIVLKKKPLQMYTLSRKNVISSIIITMYLKLKISHDKLALWTFSTKALNDPRKKSLMVFGKQLTNWPKYD